MKKLSLLIIASLFMLSTQTVNAQFDINKNINKAKQESAKSKEKKEKKEKDQKEQEEQAEKKAEEKDHPLVSRFEGAEMIYYKVTKWAGYKLPVSDKGTITWKNPVVLEGKVTRIQYTISDENNAEFVLYNYKTAFKKSGFNVLIAIANEEIGSSSLTWYDRYYNSNNAYNGLNNVKFGWKTTPINGNAHCFIASRGHDNENNKDVYAIIYAVEMDGYTLITQDVIEVEAAETGMVTAQSIDKGLVTDGHITLDGVHFNTGLSTIKPESVNALGSIAEYLNAHPEKKFFIVGHTDNVGDFDANLKLSKNRAETVINELVTKYAVNTEQLKAFGSGSTSPIASNSTDEGKAKNRRVEIVEQ